MFNMNYSNYSADVKHYFIFYKHHTEPQMIMSQVTTNDFVSKHSRKW
jgi:hypothetical protein